MEYITVKEAAKKWCYSVGTVQKWCRDGKIKVTVGAEKISGHWRIPSNAICPGKLKNVE